MDAKFFVNAIKSFFVDLYYQIQYCLVRVAIIFLENLPMVFAQGLAYILGILASVISKKHSSQIKKNLAIAYPNGIPFPIDNFIRQNFISLMYAIMEWIISQRLLYPHTWRKYIGTKAFDNLVKNLPLDKKPIFVTLHLGSFFLMADVSALEHVPCMAVIRKLYNPYITSFFEKRLGRYGCSSVLREQAYAEFQLALQQNTKIPVVLIDQHAGRTALYVEFMGRKAYTAASAAVLALKYNAPIYALTIRRKKFFQFESLADLVYIPETTGDKQADIENITRNINLALEKYIRQNPDQWFWMHRRWRD